MPGVEVRVAERCVGCGTCMEKACFVDAVRLEGGRAVIGVACRGCGHCVEVCPEGAIELTIGESGFLEGPTRRISSPVDAT